MCLCVISHVTKLSACNPASAAQIKLDPVSSRLTTYRSSWHPQIGLTSEFTLDTPILQAGFLHHARLLTAGLRAICSASVSSFFTYFNDSSRANYLKIYRTDGCRPKWPIWNSFFDHSRSVVIATNFCRFYPCADSYKMDEWHTTYTLVIFKYYAGSVHSGKRQASVWCLYACLSVCQSIPSLRGANETNFGRKQHIQTK